MEERPRGGRTWRLLGGVTLAALLALCGACGWAACAASRGWSELQRRNRELLAEAQARPAARPVLRGEPFDGNAWDDYEHALREVDRFKEQGRNLDRFIDRAEGAGAAAVQVLLERHGVALDHVRRGAARGKSQYAYRWEQGAKEMPPAEASHRLVSLAVARARLLREQGRPRDAAEFLLDACQFTRDLGHNGLLVSEHIALGEYGIVLEELRELVLTDRLTDVELGQVDRELEIVDRSFPHHGYALLNERLRLGCSIEDNALAALVVAGALNRMDRWVRELAECDGLSWERARAVSERVRREVEASWQPMVKTAMSGLASEGLASAGRQRRAQIRLLRAAARHRATGVAPELDDPFGDKLRHAEAEGKVRFWSVGRDGEDNGGRGQWDTAPAGYDIVLEIKR